MKKGISYAAFGKCLAPALAGLQCTDSGQVQAVGICRRRNKNYPWLAGVMSTWILLMGAAQGLAQTKADTTDLENHFEVDPVVISATKWSQNQGMLPSKISVLKPEQMTLLQPQTAADLLGAGGEVFIQKSQQGGGSPMIRGFAANRLLYTVDGVRMNTAIFRSGNLQNVISLDPLAISKTEVFFGPGSVVYGSDAIGGVMSFQTLTPDFADATKRRKVASTVVSRYSSVNQEFTSHFDAQIGSNKWAALTSLTYTRYGDLRMGRHGPSSYLKEFVVQRQDSTDRVVQQKDPSVQSPSGYHQTNLMQKLRWLPAPSWDFQYGFHYSETSEFSRYDRLLERRADGLPIYAIWKYGPQLWIMHHFLVAYKANSRLADSIAVRVAQQTFGESRIDRRFNDSRLRTQEEKVHAFSTNIDARKSLGKHRFYYGLEYVLNNVSSKGSAVDIRNGSDFAVPDRYPKAIWRSYGLYLNYQAQIREKWMLQVGARYSGFGIEADFSRFLEFYPLPYSTTNRRSESSTWSVGMVYRPEPGCKISMLGSTGFRAPNIDDMGKLFDFSAGEVVVPNPNLRSEYARNVELGLSKVVRNILKMDFSFYYTHLNEALVRRIFRFNGQDSIEYNGSQARVYAIQNAAFATVYGYNAGVELKLSSHLSFASLLSYQRGQEELDSGATSRSRHAAPTFGNTRLTWQHKDLTLQIAAIYSAGVSFDQLNEEERQKPFIYATDTQGNPYSPAWYTLNLKTMYRLLSRWTISAGLENITDRRYRPYSSGIAAGGRNFVLSLRGGF